MSSGDKPLVQLIGIGKRYGTGPTAFDALHHVDLSINAGEFVAIMGPSGSGKSTTMNIIGALDTPTRGQYLFNGFHVEHFTRDQRALLRRQYLAPTRNASCVQMNFTGCSIRAAIRTAGFM